MLLAMVFASKIVLCCHCQCTHPHLSDLLSWSCWKRQRELESPKVKPLCRCITGINIFSAHLVSTPESVGSIGKYKMSKYITQLVTCLSPPATILGKLALGQARRCNPICGQAPSTSSDTTSFSSVFVGEKMRWDNLALSCNRVIQE